MGPAAAQMHGDIVKTIKRLKRLASAALERLSPAPRSFIEFHSGHHRFFYPWGGAMNGQAARLSTVSALIHAIKPAMIIETGTYRGTTTEWFAGFALPVVTVESEPSFYRFSRRRLARWPNVRCVFGDSVSALAAMQPVDQPVLCYLDAHWHDALPLRDELRTIIERFRRAVIVIDDFKVPDDLDYGHDDYGPDAALDVPYLGNSGLPEAAWLFFPSLPASHETGQRRGTAFLTFDPELAALLGGMASLRAWPFSISDRQRAVAHGMAL